MALPYKEVCYVLMANWDGICAWHVKVELSLAFQKNVLFALLKALVCLTLMLFSFSRYLKVR